LGNAVLSAAVALAVSWLSFSTASRTTDVELLKLSVDILQAPPLESSRELRRWAIALLNEYSEVPLPESLRKQLADSVMLPVLQVSESGVITALRPGVFEIVGCFRGVCGSRVIVVATDSTSPRKTLNSELSR
jgi:hypothetical protein